jgi:hypothetical protein
VHAAFDLPLDQAHERGLVHGAIAERGYQGRKNAAESRLAHEVRKMP